MSRMSIAEDKLGKGQMAIHTAEDVLVLGFPRLQKKDQPVVKGNLPSALRREGKQNRAHTGIKCVKGSRRRRHLRIKCAHKCTDHINGKGLLNSVALINVTNKK